MCAPYAGVPGRDDGQGSVVIHLMVVVIRSLSEIELGKSRTRNGPLMLSNHPCLDEVMNTGAILARPAGLKPVGRSKIFEKVEASDVRVVSKRSVTSLPSRMMSTRLAAGSHPSSKFAPMSRHPVSPWIMVSPT